MYAPAMYLLTHLSIFLLLVRLQNFKSELVGLDLDDRYYIPIRLQIKIG